jgi:uncharacterized protein (DUF427 family)
MSDHSEPKPKTIKVPGPDHPITIERNAHRVVVKVAGCVVADTREALTLREASYPAVQYVPRKDVDMTLLERTDRVTYCPYKGDCAYYSIPPGVASARSMPSGPTRSPTRRSPRSRTTSRSIPTASTRFRNGQAASRSLPKPAWLWKSGANQPHAATDPEIREPTAAPRRKLRP